MMTIFGKQSMDFRVFGFVDFTWFKRGPVAPFLFKYIVVSTRFSGDKIINLLRVLRSDYLEKIYFLRALLPVFIKLWIYPPLLDVNRGQMNQAN